MKNDYLRAASSSSKRAALPSFRAGFNTTLDEAVLRLDVAKRIENFDFSSGALTQGYGLSEAQFNFDRVVGAWEYKRFNYDKSAYESILMYLNSSGNVFYLVDGEGEFVMLQNAVFTSLPYTVNYRLYGEDVILMCSANEGMLMWNGSGSAVKIEGAPFVTSLCMHFERMFVTVAGERNSVYFSDDLDPTNWNENLNEGGFIQMLDERGTLNKVISFINYVYVFRDRGISRITAYADQNEFFASNLFVGSGKIYADSVTLCMDTVLFLADDGLYRFDGLSTTKILPQLDGIIMPSSKAQGYYFGGKYYLSLCLKDEQGQGNGENNALLIYELKSGSLQILTCVSICGFFDYGEKIYALTSDFRAGEITKCGSVFGVATTKVWESGLKDFGSEKTKNIKEFFIDASKSFTLMICTENGERSFDVTPKSGITKVRVNVRGKKIGIKLQTCEQTIRLASPSFRYTLV